MNGIIGVVVAVWAIAILDAMSGGLLDPEVYPLWDVRRLGLLGGLGRLDPQRPLVGHPSQQVLAIAGGRGSCLRWNDDGGGPARSRAPFDRAQGDGSNGLTLSGGGRVGEDAESRVRAGRCGTNRRVTWWPP